MQGPENKKRVGRHAAPESESPVKDDAIRTDADLYGDETDIPLKSKKAGKKASPKKKPKNSKKIDKKQPRKQKKFQFFARLTFAEAQMPRKTRALLEVVHSDDKNSRFRRVMFLGHRMPLWGVIVGIAVVSLLVMTFLNNNNISVDQQTVTIVGLPSDLENYKMLVISDLNGKRFGDKQSSLLRSINSLSYDAVFFLGDMVGKGGDPEPFYELIDGIPSSKEMFFICGDSDPGPFVDSPRKITGTLSQLVLEDWILGAIERGAVYVDQPVCLTEGNSNIWITPSTLMNLEAGELVNTWKDQTAQEEDGVLSGLYADHETLPMTSYRYRAAQNLYNSLSSMKEEDFYLSLSHEVPCEKSIYASASHSSKDGKYLEQPELILAGHYCGGVWRLPMIGAFYIPNSMSDRNGWFPAPSDVAGLSSVGETQTYITKGLSVNGELPLMRFRFLNPPELSVLTLTATLPENMLLAQ